MMLEEDLKSFEAMVGFALFCIAVMFGEFLDIIPDPYGYIKYVIWILSIIITWHGFILCIQFLLRSCRWWQENSE